jgi:hypothetical protein
MRNNLATFYRSTFFVSYAQQRWIDAGERCCAASGETVMNQAFVSLLKPGGKAFFCCASATSNSAIRAQFAHRRVDSPGESTIP